MHETEQLLNKIFYMFVYIKIIGIHLFLLLFYINLKRTYIYSLKLTIGILLLN